jgi:broad specificity phosphatase PhoE
MARIYLIRHGETDANSKRIYQGQTNTSLNNSGKRQAKWASKFFKAIPLKTIYTSDLDRAYQTAQIIAPNNKTKLLKNPSLRERNFGAWENQSFTEIRKNYPTLYKEWFRNPDVKIPGAESYKIFSKRIIVFLEELLNKVRKNDELGIVAHGGTNRVILNYFLKRNGPKYFWDIKQDNACINIIELEKDYRLVSLINFHKNNFTQLSIKY